MKKIILFTIGLFTFVSNGQTCTSMAPMEQGVKYQHSMYKADGTLESIVDATVLSVSTGDGKLVAQVGLRGHVIGDDSIYNTTLDTECSGNVTYTDPSQLIPPEMLDKFFNEYNGRALTKPIEIPYNLHVGDELPDYFLEIFGTVQDMEIHFSSQTYGRTVIGKEQVEALSGTFDCFIIESTTHFSIEVGSMGGTAETTTEKLWVARGVGTVKMENYRNGALDRYVELSGFQR